MGRKRRSNKGSWSELILFALAVLCVYFILALFDSSFTGDTGREWGEYLRDNWGGAVIVLLLFWLYLCIAKFMKLRIPLLPRQILGTLQLYISFAFMLGYLNETGWKSDWTLMLPGSFGQSIAHFFVLNIGTFITLLLVIASFILSAYLYGSRVFRMSMPSVPRVRFRRRSAKTRKPRRTEKQDDAYSDFKPDKILFKPEIPMPKLKRKEPDEEAGMQVASDEHILSAFGQTFANLPAPTLKPHRYEQPPEEPELELGPEPEPEPVSVSSTIDIIDNALAMIDAAAPELPRTSTRKQERARHRKSRRPQQLSLEEELQTYYAPEADYAPQSDEPKFPPPLDLFGQPETLWLMQDDKDSLKFAEKQGKAIITTLRNFGISASIAGTSYGPSVTQYQLELAPGTKVSSISGLGEELAMALAVTSVRIEAPILGTHYVGIEIPAQERSDVSLRTVLESPEFESSTARLPVPLGVQIDGSILVQGLEDMPHVLVAGSSGSGRSTFLNSCILSMCSVRRPEELRLILIDPGHVEFAVYDGLPHLLAAPVNDIDTALRALDWAYSQMEDRMSNFARSKVRNLAAYNRKVAPEGMLPEIVIVVEELADIIYSEEIEAMILRLAQKSGTAGIHMILSTRRPSPDVITTLIKSNIPARAALTLTSSGDSKNMINIPDASELTGKGDMLFRNTNTPQPVRLQTAYIEEDRISDFVDYMSSNLDAPELIKF